MVRWALRLVHTRIGWWRGAVFTQSISVVRVAALAYSTVHIFRMVKDPMISFFPMNLSTENSKSVFTGVMSMQPFLISRSRNRATSTVGRGCWMSSPSSASRLPLISSRKAYWCTPVRVSRNRLSSGGWFVRGWRRGGGGGVGFVVVGGVWRGGFGGRTRLAWSNRTISANMLRFLTIFDPSNSMAPTDLVMPEV